MSPPIFSHLLILNPRYLHIDGIPHDRYKPADRKYVWENIRNFASVEMHVVGGWGGVVEVRRRLTLR